MSRQSMYFRRFSRNFMVRSLVLSRKQPSSLKVISERSSHPHKHKKKKQKETKEAIFKQKQNRQMKDGLKEGKTNRRKDGQRDRETDSK